MICRLRERGFYNHATTYVEVCTCLRNDSLHQMLHVDRRKLVQVDDHVVLLALPALGHHLSELVGGITARIFCLTKDV